MKPRRAVERAMTLAMVPVAMACGTPAEHSSTALTLVPLPAWDGGAEAGCVIGSKGVPVQCFTTYRISGAPFACPGFDDAGEGTAAECQTACKSPLVCNLSGLSDGTNAVACQSGCASPEH